MIKFLVGCGMLLFVIMASVALVDLFVNLATWLSRIKIGRWEEEKVWKEAVEKTAKKWFFHMPAVKKTDQTRYLLWDMIKGNYKNKTIQSWQSGGIYLGIAENSSEEELKSMEQQFLDQTSGKWRIKPKEVDEALLAYAILKYAVDKEKIKPAMDEMFALIQGKVQERDHCVCYRDGIADVRFVDTVGFICPFLALYGSVYHEEAAFEIAKNQIKTYQEKGLLENYSLPVHAYDSRNGFPMGIYGWGRGAGWWMLGLIDTYREWKTDWLAEILRETAEKMTCFENETGGFSSNLILKNNVDSSITAIAGYFYREYAKISGEKKYLEISQRCVKALMKNTRRTGEIDFSQGDTKGIGIYSQTYDKMPFTQGIALRIGE